MTEAVLVLEDDPFVRAGIVKQIEADPAFRVVAQASDLVAARAAIEAGTARIGVFDIQLRDGSSLSLIRGAVDRGMSIVMLTVFDDDENVYQALASGAGGYLLKGEASAGRVSEALHTLLEGGAPISPMIARRLLDELRLRPSPPAAPAPVAESSELEILTDRERQIIELFAKGSTYDEVAAMLTMSVNTVRHHVRSMYRKLHVCSKAEAVTVAFRLT